MRLERAAFVAAMLLSLVPALARAQTSSTRAVESVRASPTDVAFSDPDDPNPGSGRLQIIAGWSALGAVAIAGAQIPFCHSNTYDNANGEQRCVRFSLGVGVTALVLGVPLLVFGYRKRAAQHAWRARHGLALVAPVEVRADKHGAWVGYRAVAF